MCVCVCVCVCVSVRDRDRDRENNIEILYITENYLDQEYLLETKIVY